MLYIKSEAYLSERGTYDINEDALFTVKEKLYLVCDGVGGNGNGLLASQLLCKTIAALIHKEPILNLSAILEQAEKVFSNYKKRHRITQLMASTIAFVQINNGFVTIAWIGDTSVYQIRGGKIICKTVSHTLIQEAIQIGELTELESYFQPNRNQLTRSVKELNILLNLNHLYAKTYKITIIFCFALMVFKNLGLIRILKIYLGRKKIQKN
jgi:serine/threonine protein phosphatase PrpC